MDSVGLGPLVFVSLSTDDLRILIKDLSPKTQVR